MRRAQNLPCKPPARCLNRACNSTIMPAFCRANIPNNYFRVQQMRKLTNKSTISKGDTVSYRSLVLLLCPLMFAGCGDAFTPYVFDMTRLNQDGSTNDGKDQAGHPWACVRDNKTNLFWEVKKSEPGLQNANNTYSWYAPDQNTNGSFAGKANAGICTGSDCDTQSYVNAINAKKLCGFTDWRLPTREEMSSLVDNSVFYPGPTVHNAFF